MKLTLPNGNDIELPEFSEIEDKLKEIERILNEQSDYIDDYWFEDSVKYFLDSLSNYLIWHKEDGEKSHDKEVMSRNKTNRMIRGRKDIPFSNLSQKDRNKLFGEDGGNE